jgi:hypothetical protein
MRWLGGVGSGRNQRRAIWHSANKSACNRIFVCRLGVTVMTLRNAGHEGIERVHILFELPENEVATVASNIVDGLRQFPVRFGLRRNGRAPFVPISTCDLCQTAIDRPTISQTRRAEARRCVISARGW